MTERLRELAERIERESGIRLSGHWQSALQAALRRAAPGVAPDSFLRALADPGHGEAAMARLIDEVTVQESSFFRERLQLEALDWSGLLAAAHRAGSPAVHVWVTACAGGEEAYTIAMLAREAFERPDPPVSILATDISDRALAVARAASYRERAVRDVDARRRARWLRREAGRFAVREEVRALVRLRRHNLVRDPAPPLGEPLLQVIACRNVLIYFDAATGARVLANLRRALAPGGVLLLGAADALGSSTRSPAVPHAAPAAPTQLRPRSARRQQPRRRGRDPRSHQERLAQALRAADAGRGEDALADVAAMLKRDPLDADAHYLRGLVELSSGDADAAVVSLRRALYLDPAFGLAAFALGRAHDAAGRRAAARAAYTRALGSLEDGDGRHSPLLAQVDLGDVAAVCRARIKGGPP